MNINNDLEGIIVNTLSQIDSECINTICQVFNVNENQIHNIKSLKTGMTNRSFVFTVNNQQYIFRVPGEGTDKLINRKNEYDVYQQIKDKNICDDIIFFSPDNGYKITKYIDASRNCDAHNPMDVKKCMSFLKTFHHYHLMLNHTFDVFHQIDYYESLMPDRSCYTDYQNVKDNVFSLKAYIDSQEHEVCLSHIDSVPDNFIMTEERIYLIDWEYAAMQDPHIDIAMFAIYAMYDRNEVDQLIDIYFSGHCTKAIRLKIYCYIAACGLLWSNWCEYKATLGVDFGEYALAQYQYAKDYYRIFIEENHHA